MVYQQLMGLATLALTIIWAYFAFRAYEVYEEKKYVKQEAWLKRIKE